MSMITKITNYLQRAIDTGTIGLTACVAAWQFATDQDKLQYGDMALTALFIALAGLATLNLLKIVIKALERGEEA